MEIEHKQHIFIPNDEFLLIMSKAVAAKYQRNAILTSWEPAISADMKVAGIRLIGIIEPEV